MKCTNCTNDNAEAYTNDGITSYLCDACAEIIWQCYQAQGQARAQLLTINAIIRGILHLE